VRVGLVDVLTVRVSRRAMFAVPVRLVDVLAMAMPVGLVITPPVRALLTRVMRAIARLNQRVPAVLDRRIGPNTTVREPERASLGEVAVGALIALGVTHPGRPCRWGAERGHG